jgi:hypothetical protein
MPEAVEGGLALFVSALQGSLAAGSAVGGVLFDTFGTTGSLLTATVAAGLGSAAVSGPSAADSTPPKGSHQTGVSPSPTTLTQRPEPNDSGADLLWLRKGVRRTPRVVQEHHERLEVGTFTTRP